VVWRVGAIDDESAKATLCTVKEGAIDTRPVAIQGKGALKRRRVIAELQQGWSGIDTAVERIGGSSGLPKTGKSHLPGAVDRKDTRGRLRKIVETHSSAAPDHKAGGGSCHGAIVKNDGSLCRNEVLGDA